VIIYARFRATECGTAQMKKKFGKKMKKFLTNGIGCAKLNRLTAQGEELKTVPCKLNNAKTNK